jgi:hypothetical protein
MFIDSTLNKFKLRGSDMRKRAAPNGACILLFSPFYKHVAPMALNTFSRCQYYKHAAPNGAGSRFTSRFYKHDT